MDDAASAPRKRLTGEERIAALKARLAKEQARLSKARRSEDTRACILLGRWVMEAAKRDPQVARLAVDGLPRFLTREHDRAALNRTLEELRELVGTPGQRQPVTIRPAPPAAASAAGTFTPRPDTDRI